MGRRGLHGGAQAQPHLIEVSSGRVQAQARQALELFFQPQEVLVLRDLLQRGFLEQCRLFGKPDESGEAFCGRFIF